MLFLDFLTIYYWLIVIDARDQIEMSTFCVYKIDWLLVGARTDSNYFYSFAALKWLNILHIQNIIS